MLKHTTQMRSSWKAVILAPLFVPLLFALMVAAAPNQDRVFSFVFFFGLGCLLSYPVSLVLFLPALFLLSRFTHLTAWRTAAVGMTTGLAVYFPVAWQSYLSSGENSGPPSESYAAYLRHNFWSESWLFYVGGLFTAILYWLLAKPRARSDAALDPAAPAKENL